MVGNGIQLIVSLRMTLPDAAQLRFGNNRPGGHSADYFHQSLAMLILIPPFGGPMAYEYPNVAKLLIIKHLFLGV